MRKQGVVVPKRELTNQVRYRGDLRIIDTREAAFNRIVKLAQLVRTAGQEQHVDVLYEPQMLWMNDDRFVLTGFERIGEGAAAVDFAQSWLIEVPGSQG